MSSRDNALVWEMSKRSEVKVLRAAWKLAARKKIAGLGNINKIWAASITNECMVAWMHRTQSYLKHSLVDERYGVPARIPISEGSLGA